MKVIGGLLGWEPSTIEEVGNFLKGALWSVVRIILRLT